MQSSSVRTVKARTGIAQGVPRSRFQGGRASEAVKRYQEGMIAGTCGAATLSLWFLLLDVLAGYPLYTPHVLGTALFTGGGGLMPPAPVAISLGLVGAFTGIYWLAF